MSQISHLRPVAFIWCVLLFLSFGARSQDHPLSRRDSAEVITNLDKYQKFLGKKDYRSATDVINKVAFTYWNNNHYQEAIKYYKISLSLNERIFNENGIAMINNNLGMLYSDVGQYDLSLGHFKKTLAARKSNKEVDGIISAYVNISVVLNNLEKYQESVDMLDEALNLARERQDLDQMRSVYGMLSETYEKLGNLEQSKKYFELYRTFNDEVKRKEIQEVNEQLVKERYQKQQLALQKSKQENELLKQELEIYQKDEIIKEKDSAVKELVENLSAVQIAQRLSEQEKRNAQLETEAQARENEALQREKKYLTTVTWIIVFTAVVIILIIAYTVIRTRKHNKVLQQKNQQINDQNEKVIELNNELKDINEQQAEIIKELEETKEKLNMSEKMASIGSVVAGIAHEINNSVNFIVGSAELICKIIDNQDEKVKEEIGEDMEIIHELQETIQSGTKRTNLFISKLRSDNYKISRFIESDLSKIIDRSFMTLKHKFDEKQIQLKTEIPGELNIECIPEHVEQLLINILDNSVDAVAEKGNVEVSVSTKGKNVHISVIDDGVGISPDDLKKIYDPFFTTKDIGKGTGLGLYMAYSYAASHNGNIEVDPNVKVGSRFIIKLPIEQEKKSVEVQEQSY